MEIWGQEGFAPRLVVQCFRIIDCPTGLTDENKKIDGDTFYTKGDPI